MPQSGAALTCIHGITNYGRIGSGDKAGRPSNAQCLMAIGTDDGVVKFFDAEYGKIVGTYEIEQQ